MTPSFFSLFIFIFVFILLSFQLTPLKVFFFIFTPNRYISTPYQEQTHLHCLDCWSTTAISSILSQFLKTGLVDVFQANLSQPKSSQAKLTLSIIIQFIPTTAKASHHQSLFPFKALGFTFGQEWCSYWITSFVDVNS